MNLIKSAVLLIIVLFIGCSQTKWVNKEFDTVKSNIDTISILFPHIEYSEKSLEVSTAKLGHSIFVSRKVADVLKEIIDNGGFVSKSANIVLDSTIIDQWLPASYANSNIAYKRISDSLLKSKDEKILFPIMPELQLLIDKSPSNYFLFVSGTAYGTTEETKRYDFQQAQTFKLFYDRPFIYDYQWSGLQLQVFLVDKKSSEILWNNANDSQDTKYDPIKDEEIKALCKKLLQVR